MPTYSMKAPDGNTYQIDGPAGASDGDVAAAIQAQHPHLAPATVPAGGITQPPTGRAPAAVPVQTKDQQIQGIAQQRIAARQKLMGNSQPNWLQNLTDSAEGAISQNSFGVGPLLGAAANYATSHIKDAVTGSKTALPFSDELAVQRSMDEQDAQKSGVGRVAGTIVGAVGSGNVAGNIVKAGAAKIAGSGIPLLAPAANYLQRATTLNSSPSRGVVAKIGNAAKMIGAGTVAGGAQAAANDQDVTQGAIEGAAGTAVLGAGAKVLGKGVQIARDYAGVTPPGEILQRFLNISPDDLKARLASVRSDQGTNPMIGEVLTPAEKIQLKSVIQAMPAGSRNNVVQALQARASDVGPQLAQRTRQIIGPAMQQHVDGLAQQLAESRAGPGAVPTPDEIQQAQGAARSTTDMEGVRGQVGRNIMAPHNDTPVAGSVNDLLPQTMTRTPDTQVPTGVLDGQGKPVMRSVPGQIQAVISDEDQPVANLIRQHAAPLRNPTQITGGNVADIISSLSDVAERGGTDAQLARNAAQHLSDNVLPQNMQTDITRMREAHAANSRVLEGMSVGGQQVTRNSINTGTSGDAARLVRNQFDTPEGSAGRAAGQGNRLLQDFNETPGEAVGAAQNIAGSPQDQEAISANLAGDQGQQIAAATTAQTRGLSNLQDLRSSVNPNEPKETDLTGLVHNLMRLAPGSMIHSKGIAVNAILSATHRIPEAQASKIADALFSQNPAQIVRGIKFLNNAGADGQAALRALNASIAAGGASAVAAGAFQQPADATPAPAIDTPDFQPPAAPNVPAPDPAQGQGPAADASASPYYKQLSDNYGSQTPEFKAFTDKIQSQESRGHQHDKNGNPLISSAGAVGVMQVEPKTGKAMAADLGLPWDEAAFHHDAAYNKLIGMHYLGTLVQQFKGDTAKAAAAYNAGPGAVIKALKAGGNWLSRLPQETQNYVRSVA